MGSVIPRVRYVLEESVGSDRGTAKSLDEGGGRTGSTGSSADCISFDGLWSLGWGSSGLSSWAVSASGGGVVGVLRADGADGGSFSSSWSGGWSSSPKTHTAGSASVGSTVVETVSAAWASSQSSSSAGLATSGTGIAGVVSLQVSASGTSQTSTRSSSRASTTVGGSSAGSSAGGSSSIERSRDSGISILTLSTSAPRAGTGSTEVVASLAVEAASTSGDTVVDVAGTS